MSTTPPKRPELHASYLRLWSVGRAAENLPLDTNILEILPIEVLPYVNGDVNAEQGVLSHSGKDAFGNEYSVKVKTANTIKAEWCPFGSNRLTAPNIRRAERVIILKYADTDKYYWVEQGRDGFLRRLETVIWAFSNTRDESTTKLTPANSWFFEVSTHKKTATLRTNKSDGEKFAYLVQVNAKDGNITLMDDADNFIQLDSANRRLHMHNSDDSEVIIDKKSITLNSKDSITENTTTYKINCKDYTLTATNSITENTKTHNVTNQTTNWTALSSYTLKTQTLMGQVPASTFTGTFTIQQLLSALAGIAAPPGGGAGGSASVSIGIPVSVDSSMDVSGSITNDGVPVDKTHHHTTGAPGSDTSTPH